MKKCASVFICLATAAVLAGAAQAQDVYYVQSLRARILAGPSFRARVVGEASRGAKLFSSGREGGWVKVTVKRTEGFVPALIVSKFPPLARQSVITGEGKTITRSVRRRASSYTSAAAARGLTQDDRRRLSAAEKTDYGGLEKMEAFTVSPEEVARFMEGGKP